LEDKELVFETLETIADSALPRLERFKAQELNNLAWGFARLGHRTEKAEKLFEGVAKQLKQRIHQFKPQDVGTTLWSFSTAEYFDLDAFRTGASRLNFQHIRSFKPQEMSNTVRFNFTSDAHFLRITYVLVVLSLGLGIGNSRIHSQVHSCF
jgi:hypothetical protein